jgi:hypothetical protein
MIIATIPRRHDGVIDPAAKAFHRHGRASDLDLNHARCGLLGQDGLDAQHRVEEHVHSQIGTADLTVGSDILNDVKA